MQGHPPTCDCHPPGKDANPHVTPSSKRQGNLPICDPAAHQTGMPNHMRPCCPPGRSNHLCETLLPTLQEHLPTCDSHPPGREAHSCVTLLLSVLGSQLTCDPAAHSSVIQVPRITENMTVSIHATRSCQQHKSLCAVMTS